MVTHNDVPVNELIENLAKELHVSGAVMPPPWATYVKTGAHKERPPLRHDWWQIRAAAVLRKIALQGPIGVSKLRRHFGGKRNRGMAPERVYKGSGAIIRKLLQQLDKAGLTRHTKVGIHSGRIITAKGLSALNKAAVHVAKELGITIASKTPAHASSPEPPKPEDATTPPVGEPAPAESKPGKKKAPKKA